MKKSRAIVVIPVHSSTPSEAELLAFAQCYRVLSNHDIVLLHPDNLDLKSYFAVVPDLKCISINPFWQSSLENYNRLKCSSLFYRLFSEYEYILTYELDAWVFKDELNYWCDKDYDYIGAPWFEGLVPEHLVIPYKFTLGGNSGFSLRKTSSCLKVIEGIESLKKIDEAYQKLQLHRICAFQSILRRTDLKKIFNISSGEFLYKIFNNKSVPEDKFWSVWVATTYPYFKVASQDDAMKFSFEVNSQYLFQLNDSRLPFGCHAWLKYEPEFWKPYISS